MNLAKVILTFNAGSSSLKFAAYSVGGAQDMRALAAGQIEGLGATPEGSVKTPDGQTQPLNFAAGAGSGHDAAMGAVLGWLRHAGFDEQVAAVGHRVVHGGPDLVDPIAIDDAVLETLRRLIPLAPLHQPHNIAGIEAARKAFPHAPQIACFDTAFHRAHPFVSDTFALPRSYYDEGVRRYGFHGISYEYVSRKLRSVAPGVARRNVIIAHLGNGASMCAIRDGRSIASSMSFTALDGLPMGTRCGEIDPGVLLYLMTEKKMDAAAISDLLYKNSGLKGMSGVSQDMRELEESKAPGARDAIAYFVSRVRQTLGALAAALGGAQGVVFTAGIGEHSAAVREAALTDMEWMGIVLDREANRAGAQIISAHGSPTTVFVIPTDEERMIAEHTVSVSGAFEQ
jgi:acetate kinase